MYWATATLKRPVFISCLRGKNTSGSWISWDWCNSRHNCYFASTFGKSTVKQQEKKLCKWFAELKVGDKIVWINKQPATLGNLTQLLSHTLDPKELAKYDGKIQLLVRRGEFEFFIKI